MYKNSYDYGISTHILIILIRIAPIRLAYLKFGGFLYGY